MPFGNIMRTSVNTDVSYQFTGQEYEAAVDLHNFRARFYDNDLGFFYEAGTMGIGFGARIIKSGKILTLDNAKIIKQVYTNNINFIGWGIGFTQ